MSESMLHPFGRATPPPPNRAVPNYCVKVFCHCTSLPQCVTTSQIREGLKLFRREFGEKEVVCKVCNSPWRQTALQAGILVFPWSQQAKNLLAAQSTTTAKAGHAGFESARPKAKAKPEKPPTQERYREVSLSDNEGRIVKLLLLESTL